MKRGAIGISRDKECRVRPGRVCDGQVHTDRRRLQGPLLFGTCRKRRIARIRHPGAGRGPGNFRAESRASLDPDLHRDDGC
jgi:hypothetical protein